MKIHYVANRASSCRRGALLFAIVLTAALLAFSSVTPSVGRFLNPLADTLLTHNSPPTRLTK